MPQRLPNRRYGWIHRDSTFSVVFMRCFYMRCFKFCPSQWRWTHTYWQGHPDELSILKRWWSSTMDSSTSWQYDDNIWWQYNTIYDHIWLRWWSYCPSRTMWLGRTGFVFFFLARFTENYSAIEMVPKIVLHHAMKACFWGFEAELVVNFLVITSKEAMFHLVRWFTV